MKNSAILLCSAALLLAACSVKSTSNNTADGKSDSTATATVNELPSQPIFAKMEIKDTIKVGEPINLKFTVYNGADTTQQFCKWHTPFEPLMSKYVDVKADNGEEPAYQGAMAKRIMPPPASSYIKVNTKDSISVTADLAKAFAIKTPAKYTITYVGQNMSGLVVKDSVSFIYVK